jgi:NADPH:quinone reductase-like Zn-dependent oxidoreductase
MKAVRFHEYGDADVLRYEDTETPEPGAGEVLIRVAASTFNPVDDGIRGGYLREAFPLSLPHTPGVEVSGTIEALSAQVADVQVGDPVIAFLPMTADGSAAEFVVAPSDVLAAAPRSIALADAAALPMVGLTAWQALFDDADLRSGQRVLINGAGGAVGHYAVQFAKRAGAHVIATASPRSADLVTAAGADEVIDYAQEDISLSAPVDVLLNLARIAPERLAALTALVGPDGVVANTVPAVPNPGDVGRSVRAVNVFVRNDSTQLAEIVAMADRGEITVSVAERVALADLADVHARAATGALPGRVIVLPAG